MDRVDRRKKNDENRQQGSGSGMHAEHPQLPPTSEGHRDTSTESPRQRAMDIPFHVAANEVEAVMNQQGQFVGN
jgi:hypothetical protein